ncbi:hypothetical protein ACFSKM_14925 [Ancylobacter dichloromethanicus]
MQKRRGATRLPAPPLFEVAGLFHLAKHHSTGLEGSIMAKQQRSNREAKKPKKTKDPVTVPSLAKGLSTPITLPKKKS